MVKKIFIGMVIIILLIFTLIVLSNCSKEIPNTAYEELIISLENMGFKINAEDVEEDILLGQRKWITINENDNISVYLYEDSEKMEEDASYIHEGGTSYNNGEKRMKISWVSYPHFFKTENVIILYVGENLEIINSLEGLLGSQFAGYKE